MKLFLFALVVGALLVEGQAWSQRGQRQPPQQQQQQQQPGQQLPEQQQPEEQVPEEPEAEEEEQAAESEETSDSVTEGLTSEEIAAMLLRGNADCENSMTIEVEDGVMTITTNGLPDHAWGCVNPNSPISADNVYQIPSEPSFSNDGPQCLNPNTLAVASNGVSYFNPLTNAGKNAVEGPDEEGFDCCSGHADESGGYHYHKLPAAVSDTCSNPVYDSSDEDSQFLGVAFDGFPIYSAWSGLDESDLDECHGTTLPDGRYAYIATDQFPYIIGCFQGDVIDSNFDADCSGVANGGLCDCLWGVGDYDDFTDSDKRSLVNRIFDLLESSKRTHSNRHQARRDMKQIRTSHKLDLVRSLLTERSTLDECFVESCGDNSYSNGACMMGAPPPGK